MIRALLVCLHVVGPSTGRWYAGDGGLDGLGFRALSFAGMSYGLALVMGSECNRDEGCGASHRDAGVGLMLGGAALWVGSSIADVVLTERAARRWNNRHALALTPTVGNTPGLALTGQF